MVTGHDLLALAESRLGETYLNKHVPKDDPEWHGPWDCAELGSWVVYQAVGRLYGCASNDGDPAKVEAYTGWWVRDCGDGTLPLVTREDANVMPGVILVRRPPSKGMMGHLAISDGRGGTVEAAGLNLGVRRGEIEGRQWHYYAQIPGVTYAANADVDIQAKPVPYLLDLSDPPMAGSLVYQVQNALKQHGFDPGPINGRYGVRTVAAVYAFQQLNSLVADGVVGPETASKLGIDGWPP